MNENTKSYRVLIESGPRRDDGSREELGTIRLPVGVTEEQADDVAREVMSLLSRLAREQGWRWGVVTGSEEIPAKRIFG